MADDLIKRAPPQANGVSQAAKSLIQTPAANFAAPAPNPVTPDMAKFHGDGRYGAPANPVPGAPTPGAPTVRPATGVQNWRGGLRTAGKFVPAAIGAAFEAKDVYDVAKDKNSTGVDVGTQAFEGVSKLAGATAGGLAGASVGGPFAPLTGLAGGIAGYYAPGLVTKGLRSAFGMDTSSPIDRVGQATAAGRQAPAPYNPNQTAATAARAGLDLRGQTRLSPAQDPRLVNADNSRPELGRSRDFSKELNGARAQLPADLREGVVHKTTDAQGRVTYSGRNVAPRADGSTQMVDGMGRDLTMRGRVDNVRGAPAFGPNGGYASDDQAATGEAKQAAIDAALTNPDGSVWTAQDNAIMKANLRDGADPYRGTSRGAAVQAQENAPKRGEVGFNNYMKNKQLDADRAVTLRGQDMDLEGRMAPAKAAERQRVIAARIFEQAGGDHTKAAKIAMSLGMPAKDYHDAIAAENTAEASRQTMGTKARENMLSEFAAFDAEGKPDPSTAQMKANMARQIFPGIDSTNEAVRNKGMSDAKEMMGIFEKARTQDKVGFDALKFWQQKRPTLSGMPDVRGLRDEQVGFLDGVITPGASSGDVLIKRKDGSSLNLGQLNSRQRELLETAQKTGWGK